MAKISKKQSNKSKPLKLSPVLIVGESPKMKTFLEGAGYEVITVSNREEADEIIAEKDLSLILWDQNLEIETTRLAEENKSLHQQLLTQQVNLARTQQLKKNEIELSERLHQQLLLNVVPENIPGLEIDYISLTSKNLDADFFDFHQPSSQHFDLAFGDVMGKGMVATLVGTTVKSHINRIAKPSRRTQILDEKGYWEEDLHTTSEIMQQVHQQLISQLIELEHFVTLFYGRFHLTKQILSYISCGCTQPIHHQSKKQTTELLNRHTPPLGMIEFVEYQSSQTPYAEGDLFLFYSDGTLEIKNAEGELFGIERLIQLVELHKDLSSHELLEKIREAISLFTQKFEFDDVIFKGMRNFHFGFLNRICLK